MGPKAKKGKKEEVEVVETADQAEWKQLKNEADRLHKLTKKEEHDFNEFQQQREKLNYFWIVEKKKLEDKRVELRNKDRELQDLEEKHQVEIKIYKQRLKHLLYEHQNEITRKKTEAEEALKMAKEMGLNPKSLIKNIPSKSEQWKAPVSVWIREMYEKRQDKALRKKDRREKITSSRKEGEAK